MSSSCLSGAGGRTYGFEFEFVKSTSSSITRTSHTSSSPSSTISESSNSQLAISTRKPRTARKRPNQTYNEAAALLSTAYPNLFSSNTLKSFAKPSPQYSNGNISNTASFLDDSSDLLLPFRVFDTSSFLLHQYKPSCFAVEPKVVSVQHEKPCQSPGEISSRVNSLELEDHNNNHCCAGEDDFDAESMLDEEIEEGIDSIMGSGVELESSSIDGASSDNNPWSCFGGKLDFRLGLRRAGVRALRSADDGNWWNFPAVDILQISPKAVNKPAPQQPVAAAAEKAKKKKKKVEKPSVEVKNKSDEFPKLNNIHAAVPKLNSGLMLKLNYDGVRDSWSDRGSPFGDDGSASDLPGNDVTARLSQIDLLWENGGMREASVLRYKEKRRTRLFSKKIRYQVRKVNADRRPRMQLRYLMTCLDDAKPEQQQLPEHNEIEDGLVSASSKESSLTTNSQLGKNP
ncbi:protein CHLOROPLAST IMPORT APPARATUS 2 isoform X1 [Arachis duranensis]|uniref:Protein CHLOROPLAST IMPORT APPARATUS 2 isoform X1 n=1 Tax=Arachis duranensis TaxID=130453 RepID=A0A9C6WV81_ARADU|nr:protein CHLOROPLAST IMPORT APPARATUS 2 isoform X1 [Arachis duranensis]